MAKDQHWADGLAEHWVRKHKGDQVVQIGWSPSGTMHIGFLREMVLGDVAYRALRDAGASVRFVFFVDSCDPLRDREAAGKPWYKFLPESFREHVGKPVFMVPDPEGVHSSYVEHFFAPVREHMKNLGVEPDVYFSHEAYKAGMFTDIITTYLDKNDRVREILAEVTGESKSEGWCGARAICGFCGRIDRNRITGWDTAKKTVTYKCSCGLAGEADYSRGEVKLDWRLDWPARWAALGVTVEPFGKDHSAAGGSYDSGRRLAKEILGVLPPEPVPYEWLHDKDGKPFSSSRGTVINPGELLQAAAPEILRYFMVSTRPNKSIRFDPGAGLLDLYRDYERIEAALAAGEPVKNTDKRDYEFSQVAENRTGGSHIPYRNLISLLQISGGDRRRLKGMLVRAGYPEAAENWEEIEPKIRYAENWIKSYAPPETRMGIQAELPAEAGNLREPIKQFLLRLREVFVGEVPTADEIHNTIYTLAREEIGLDPKEAFEAVYLVFLNLKRGPRAGWFLHSLEPEFVAERLRQAGGGA